jgi:hypothetical protein
MSRNRLSTTRVGSPSVGPYPPLWLPRQPAARHTPAALLSTTPCRTTVASRTRSVASQAASRYDTPIPISLGVSQHLQASCAFVAHSPSFWLRAFARKLQSNQARLRSGSLHHRFPQVFLITATPLNLHSRFLIGCFLRTAVSDPPRTPPEIYPAAPYGPRPIQH